MAIPQELAQATIWSPTFRNPPKRPVFPSNSPKEKLLDLRRAQETTQANVGIILASWHPFIVIDIDHATTIPEVFNFDFSATYMEWSLSQTGIHIVFKLSAEAFHQFKKATPINYVKAKDNWEGQFSFANNFMVMTGNKLPESPDTITELSLREITELLRNATNYRFPSIKQHPGLREVKGDIRKELNLEAKTSFGALKRLVQTLPLDQSPRIVQAYEKLTGQVYCHYDYWLLVGMAIHYESFAINKSERGLGLFLDWSKTDPSSFECEEDVINKWNSFTDSSDNPVTVNTLKRLHSLFAYNWPDTIKGQPDPRSIKNLEYAYKQLDIQVFSINTALFVKAPEYLTTKYFGEFTKFFDYTGPITYAQLKVLLGNIYQQECRWTGNHWFGQVLEYYLIFLQPIDPVALWLNTPANLPIHASTLPPEKCTFETLVSGFRFKEGVDVELAKLKIYKFLMQIIKMSRPSMDNEPNEGMLILSGPENTRKTSFFKFLFPPCLNFFVSTWFEDFVSDKQKRDFNRLLASKALIYLDECDTIFKSGQIATEFKKILTSTTVEYTELYSKEPIQTKRRAALAGTTNVDRLQMSNTGSRRIWFVPIEFIEMEKINLISRYHLFKNLEKEFDEAVQRGEQPWIMTPEESREVVASNSSHSTISNAREILNEMFPILTTDKMDVFAMTQITKSPMRARVDHPQLFSLKRLQALIKENYPYAKMPSLTELRHAARDLSMQYTRQFGSLTLNNGWIYDKGDFLYTKDPSKRFVLLPKLLDD